MNQQTATNRDKTTPPSTNKRGVYKISLYNEFILWSAMPPVEKNRLGIESQNAFCDFYKISHNTPTPWKLRPDFYERVDKILIMWARDKKPDIVQGIYRSAVKGNSDSQRIWLQYFEGWTEKKQLEVTTKVDVSPHDIRALIDVLPEPLRSKHYGNLRELFDDASAVKNARVIEDDIWSERPPIGLLGEADHDAPIVSNEERVDEVARSYPKGVRCDVVRTIHPYHYQSAERWREEQVIGDSRV